MPNKLLTPDQAAKGMLTFVRRQIKEMKKEGLSAKEIQAVISAAFGGLMYGPM